MQLNIIILAAGIGSRMKSSTPKVLHKIGDKTLLGAVINVARSLNPEKIFVVYSPKLPEVKNFFAEYKDIIWIEQTEQLGTAHAVLQVLPNLSQFDRTLILCGDVPLIKNETLQNFINITFDNNIGLLTAIVTNPKGLGRITRNFFGKFKKIIEEKDASTKEQNIKEINTGIMLIPNKYLHAFLPNIKNNNAQKEYYLPDIFIYAHKNKIKINIQTTTNEQEILGINDQEALALASKIYNQEKIKSLLQNGLCLLDTNTFYFRGNLQHKNNITIDANVIIEGTVSIGKNCYIGANVILINAEIHDNVIIKANSIIENSIIQNDCVVGPFARIRPNTILHAHAKVGNFVEIKKATIGERSKVNHLSYIGDATLGENVNIGAGTITCNYDGKNKYETIIGNNVLVGSNSALVAPVTIGDYAIIGAGSVITSDAPKNKITIARSRQVSVEKK